MEGKGMEWSGMEQGGLTLTVRLRLNVESYRREEQKPLTKFAIL